MTAAAGLGKSRLLVEAARLFTEAASGSTRARPRPSAPGRYGAWHGIWAAALDVGIDDPADQQRSRSPPG